MPEVRVQPAYEAHFESLERQRLAARFGMWVFITSEILLFAGLFALYATGRADFPRSFAFGVEHNIEWIGTLNTFVLLTSSAFVAQAVHALRANRHRLASAFVLVTIALGLVFLGLKALEYHDHLQHGQVPGGLSDYFREHAGLEGLPHFFTLYWLSTGTHAVHVTIGLSVLLYFAIVTWRRSLSSEHAHRLEIAALYWHLVDAIWIFLWPLYYLAK